MSTLIKFDFKELKQLAIDKQSCIVEKTVTQKLALEPWSLGNLKESIKNSLDFKIGKFIKELNGILISFKNLRVLKSIGAIKNDNSDLNFEVQADYYIFQPYVGATLKGIVSKKYTTHLVVLLYRVFNVVIPRPTEEHKNTWPGLDVEENQEIAFKIVALDMYGALPYIRGELDERLIKYGNDGTAETIETGNGKIMAVSYQPQLNEKTLQTAKSYKGPNTTTKNIVSTDNNSIQHPRQIGDVIEVNLNTSKNKNKRHKDHSQKYCDTDLKHIEPKQKYWKNIED